MFTIEAILDVDVASMFIIKAILDNDVASMFTIKATLDVDVASILVNFAKHRQIDHWISIHHRGLELKIENMISSKVGVYVRGE